MADFQSKLSELIAMLPLLRGFFANATYADPLITQSVLTAQIRNARNSNRTSWEVFNGEIAADTLQIPFLERDYIINLNTEGSAPTDDLVTIQPDAATVLIDGQRVMIRPTSPANVITLLETGNIRLMQGGSFDLKGTGAMIGLRWSESNQVWSEEFRYPKAGDNFYNPSPIKTVDASGAVYITENDGTVYIEGAHSGEVLSTAEVNLTACAIGDTATVYVQRPTGITSLGTYTMASPGTFFEAPLWRALINAGTATHGFTAVAVGSLITISAPAGSGTDPQTQSWSFWVAITGTGTTTVPANLVVTQFGVAGGGGQIDGVAGTPGSDEVLTLTAGKDGQTLILNNSMSGGNFLKFVAGASFLATFYLSAGAQTLVRYSGQTNRWEMVAAARTEIREFTPAEAISLPGTYNGVALTTYLSAYSWSGAVKIWSFQPSLNEGAGFDAKSVPTGYVDGSDIQVFITVAGSGGATTTAKFHLGYRFISDGDDISAALTYTGSPFNITIPATGQEQASHTLTITPAAGEALPGDTFTIVLIREGTGDTYAGNVDFIKCEVRFPSR